MSFLLSIVSGLGQPWTRDGGIPQGCPLSMMFIVALCRPWCRYLGAQCGVSPQLYADNLKCVCRDLGLLLRAARFTAGYVRLVGQEPLLVSVVLLGTSEAVRAEMRGWALSDEGHRWTVKLDFRDLGGHHDTTLRGWSSTLSLRVRLAISRLDLIFARPLDFYGRIRVVRAMFLPCALHGVEASYLSKGGFFEVACCHYACCLVLLVLVLYLAFWMDQTVVILLFVLSGFGFGLLSSRPEEFPWLYQLLDLVRDGCPGHGPIHALVANAHRIGFSWDSLMTRCDRPGLPGLSNLAGPIQNFRSAILDAWRNKVAADLCARRGFRGGPLLDISVRLFLFVFCGGADGDGHLFWECPYPLLVEIRENPEFHDLMRMDKSHWPRCLLWHGWLPLLSGAGGWSPWAVSTDDAAVCMIESALGSYSSDVFQGWDVPQSVDSRLHADNWRYRRWGHFDDHCSPDGLSSSCVGFSSLPGPLQTVQRAEFWGVVLALQATNAVHLGVDNLNVVRHGGRLFDGLSCVRPLELVDDGDLIDLIRKLLSIRGEGTLCVFLRSRVVLTRVLSAVAKCGSCIVMVILVLMKLLTSSL